MKRYQIIFDGQVQGVGMRAFCMQTARKNNLTGNVRNMSNGMVECFVQGESDNIDKFLVTVSKGNIVIKISNYKVKEVPVVEGEKNFKYYY